MKDNGSLIVDTEEGILWVYRPYDEAGDFGDWAEIISDEWEIEETPYLRIRKGGLVINCEHETEPEEGFERREAEAIADALNNMED